VLLVHRPEGAEHMSSNDEGRIAALFRSHHRVLVICLTRMVRCPQRAEDLAQVAWLRLLAANARGSCDDLDDAALRAYLFTVARNAFLDEYTRKHEAIRTSAVDPFLIDMLASQSGDGTPGPDEAIERQQEASAVRAAVRDLPVAQRRVIALWACGTSIRDMASTCGSPPDTVLSRKKYALARMRGRLGATPLALR